VKEEDFDGAGADALGPDLVSASDDGDHADSGDADAGWVEGVDG
jgi:hypothetical protein